MKIILYVILIAVFAAVAYGLYMRFNDIDLSGVTESITSTFNNAASWINEKIQYVGSKLE